MENETENVKVQLSVNLVNALLTYLNSKPFNEVAQLINGIHLEAKQNAPKQEEKKD
jgi:hypothetical protein